MNDHLIQASWKLAISLVVSAQKASKIGINKKFSQSLNKNISTTKSTNALNIFLIEMEYLESSNHVGNVEVNGSL